MGKPLQNNKPFLLVGLVFIVLACRLFLLWNRYSVNVFSADQWIFEESTIFDSHSTLKAFLWQHGPHRQGLGALLELIVGPITSWSTRAQGFVIVVVICLACAGAVLLKRRLFRSLNYIDSVIPAIFLTPLHYQIILENVNVSHGPLPLLLLITFCLALTISVPRLRVVLLLLINFFLIFTGFGLFMGVLTPVLFAFEFWRKRDRLYAVALLLSVASFALFFVHYRYMPAATCFSPHPANPVQYFLFSGLMFAEFLGANLRQNVPIAVFAALLLVVIFCFSWMRAVRNSKLSGSSIDLTIAILLSYSLLFSFLTAYGRLCIGFAQADEPRYATYLVLGFFGLYLAALSARIQFERRIFLTGIVIMSLLTLRISPYDHDVMESTRSHKQAWKDCYRQHQDLNRCDTETGYAICWNPEAPDMQQKLDLLQRKHWNLFAE